MNLSIRCHGCSHRFQRTAAQVLADDRCPHCSSRDIDLDESSSSVRTAGHGEAGSCEVCGSAIRPGPSKGSFVHYDSMMEMAHPAQPNAATLSWYGENAPEYLSSTAELGEPERGLCPRCNTAGLSVATGTCTQCGYVVMDEHEMEAVDWLLELRRLQNEDGLSFDEAKARLGSRTAANTEPNDTPGSQTCPGCGTANYDGSTCSNCGYTPEDYTKDSSRKTAQWFDDRATKQWYQPYIQGISDSGSGPYQAVQAIGAPGYAVVNLDTNEIVSSGNSWYDRASGAEEDAQRWNANPALAPDTSGGNDYTGLTPTASTAPIFTYAAKVNAIASDVLASNPGMGQGTARAIAMETMRRYPVVAKRR